MNESDTIEAFRLISRCFSYPDDQLARELSAGSFGENAPWIDDSGIRAAYGGMLESDILSRLRPIYTRLFIGLPTPEVSPYESSQRSRIRGQKNDLFVNRYALSAKEAYRSHGLGAAQGNVEPPDHIVAEAEFAAYLAYGEFFAKAGVPSESPHSSEGASPRCELSPIRYEEFYSQHIASWFWILSDQLREVADEPLYRYAACILDVVAPAGKEAEEERRAAAGVIAEASARDAAKSALQDSLSRSFFASELHTPDSCDVKLDSNDVGRWPEGEEKGCAGCGCVSGNPMGFGARR